MVLLFGTAALYLLGMAIKNPIALRMDHHGISGFYTAPARWSDIKKVAVTTGSKNEKYLSLALKDPIAFRNHQTPFQRFTSWQNGAATGYHITIPQSVLLDVTVETLAEHAHAFHQSTHADVT